MMHHGVPWPLPWAPTRLLPPVRRWGVCGYHSGHCYHAVQANNAVVKTFGEPRQEQKLYNHVDLVQLLDFVDLEKGTETAGGLVST